MIRGDLKSGATLNRLLDEIRTEALLVLTGGRHISITTQAIETMLKAARSPAAGIVYTDYYEANKGGESVHPLNDYQPGSVRDDFDFGSVLLFSENGVRATLQKHGPIRDVEFAGLYDLRLKVSIDHALSHLREPLYEVTGPDDPAENEKLFAYVDPRNRSVQREMEMVFTDYLKKIGAYLSAGFFRQLSAPAGIFPVEASVVVPVKNRKDTVAEAVQSALSQQTDFSFNVLVVDNHSTDGTTDILSGLSGRNPALRHLVPQRTDLGIGGCWNQALLNESCGRFAVQLDSDDLYADSGVLRKMVEMLRSGPYGMVIGAYEVVDFDLRQIAPGLIDHREWTDWNGRNNALRINGLGAPRAFDTGLMRQIGFLNVSYGEDYAAALRICREYRIGRIYDSLYLCRRWAGNTDAALTIEQANRNDAFKDSIRTDEIRSRQKLNGIE
jgi:hypothetical protein